jgi:hypothetical protein
MSAFISSIERVLNLCFLYRLQNLHLFHEQFRVMRNKRLSASLGGLIGPISNTFDI